MRGADLAWFRKLRAATRHPIIAAGGIRSRREIAVLEKLGMKFERMHSMRADEPDVRLYGVDFSSGA